MQFLVRGKVIQIDSPDCGPEYFASGDLHGNDNFRTPTFSVKGYEILDKAGMTDRETIVAITVDGKPCMLNAAISRDCTVDIITTDSDYGKEIYYHSMVFFLAETLSKIGDYVLENVQYFPEKAEIVFTGDVNRFPDGIDLKEKLSESLRDRQEVQIIKGWQKAMVLSRFPKVEQPYCKEMLAEQDEYDFLPVAMRNQFVFVLKDEMQVLAMDGSQFQVRRFQIEKLQEANRIQVIIQ